MNGFPLTSLVDLTGGSEPVVSAGDVPFFHKNELVGGRFQILGFLGQGGLGQVYEAWDVELGQRVALKTIRPEAAASRRARTRFKREVLLARQVTHPNVCRLFDIVLHPTQAGRDEVLLVSMELLAGETLAQRLRRSGPLAAAEALPLARQMAAALEASHRAGVVHGDFKSGNVMLVGGPEGARAVVTDFGLARSTSEGSGEPEGLAGTPAYMAPERLAGEPSSPASDLWAFGAVLHEMRTGRPPSPERAAVRLEPAWEGVIRGCLAARPADRFASAREAVEALEPRRRRRAPRWGLLLVLLASILAVPALETPPRVELELPPVRSRVAAELYQEGLDALRRVEPREALERLQRAAAAEPGSPVLHEALSRAWRLLGDLRTAAAEAERAYSLAAQRQLTTPQELFFEAALRAARGEWEEALERYGALWTYEPGNLDRGLDLAQAQLGARRLTEARGTLERLRRLPAGRRDPRLDLLEAFVAWELGDSAVLRGLIPRLRAQAARLGNPILEAWAWRFQARLTWQTQGDAAAVRDAERSIEIFARLDVPGGLAMARRARAYHLREIDPREAAREAALARRQFHLLGDPVRERNSINTEALVVAARDPERAGRLYREALEIARAIGDRRGQAASHNNLALLELGRGELRSARENLTRAQDLADSLGNRGLAGAIHLNLGTVHLRLGELEEARLETEAARQHFEELQPGWRLAELNLASLALEGGRVEAARRHLEAAERQTAATPESLQLRAILLWQQGRPARALATLREALAAPGAPSDGEAMEQELRLTLAEILADFDPVAAEKEVHEIRSGPGRASNDPMQRAWAAQVLARSLLLQGRREEARRALEGLDVSRLEDFAERFEHQLVAAQIQVAGGEAVSAAGALEILADEAEHRGLERLRLEAVLALGEAELAAGRRREGRRRLAEVEERARTLGLLRIAGRADEAGIGPPVPLREPAEPGQG